MSYVKATDREYYIVEGKTSSTSTIRDIDDDDDMPSKSFKLNYRQGNIDGGYGIFTGINKVTKSIKVSQGSSPF